MLYLWQIKVELAIFQANENSSSSILRYAIIRGSKHLALNIVSQYLKIEEELFSLA